MKKLVIELMNHGYSQDQAQRFIGKFIKTYLSIDPEKRKELEEKYVAADNEAVVYAYGKFNDPEAVKNARED